MTQVQTTDPKKTATPPQDPSVDPTDPKDPQKTAGGQDPTVNAPTNTDPTPGEPEDLGFTDKQKAYIKSLRDENAKYRTKAKDLESKFNGVNERFSKIETGLKSLFGEGDDDKLTPEQRVEQLQSQNEVLEINTALTEAALEYGVGKEDFKYFKFLVTEKLGELKDNEELSDEEIATLAKQAKAKSAASTTTVVEGAGGNPPAPGAPGGISQEEFAKMGINERSKLYGQNPKLYEQLLAQERAAKKA